MRTETRWLFVLVLLATLSGTVSAFEEVAISQITADLNFQKDYGGIAAGSSLIIDLNLTFTLESLNTTLSNITVTADSTTDSTTIDLIVNGVLVADDAVITGGSSQTWTFPDFAAAGVDMNSTRLTINITAVANATTSDILSLVCDDKPVVSNFSYTVSEVKLSKPEIKFYDTDSFYSVKQKITISQDSDLNITDVKCTFTYPKNSINKGDTSHNYGDLNSTKLGGSPKSHEVSFQKRGPYVGKITNHISNDIYITEIDVFSPENLTAKLIFDPTEKPWSKYFPKFSKDRIIAIDLNGAEVKWEDPPELIITEDMNLNKGWNTINISYEKPVTFVPYAIEVIEPPWYEEEFLGVPIWLWLTGIVFLGIVAIYYAIGGRR